MGWLALWHVVSVGLFSGAVLAALAVQSLLSRALEDAERKPLARAAAALGQVAVMPVMYLAFVSGLVYFAVDFQAIGRLPYVHAMFGLGVLAVGMASVWKAKARQLARGLDEGKPYAELKPLVQKGFVFAGLALVFILAAYVAAMWPGL